MKISWGYKIVILYLGFVFLILFMVFFASRQKVDLVAKDYYEQELAYQNKINHKNASNSLKNKLSWVIEKGELTLAFPPECRGYKIKSNLYFFRPSDVILDKKMALVEDTSLVKKINLKSLERGLYKMQISWSANTKEYDDEGLINIK